MRLLLLPLCLLAACGDKSDEPGEEADADTDADTDSDTDSDTDVDVEPWSWCPDGDAWVGDESWTGTLTATGGALYCSAPEEGASFAELLADKRQLLIVEGSWAHPSDLAVHDMALPVCTRFPGDAHADMDGVGTVEMSFYDYDGGQYLAEGTQPLTDGYTITYKLGSGGSTFDLTLDGGGSDGGGNASWWSIGGVDVRPCRDDSWNAETHLISFEGGQVELLLQVQRETGGDMSAGTEQSAFPWAAGSLDDTDFDITEPFQLLYSPDHHHFGRHWVVLFDEPIGEACGLQVDVDDISVDAATVQLVDCNLDGVETRAVTEVDFTQ